MTQFGTLLCAVLSCWLMLFRLLTHRTAVTILVAGSIFYFTPVLRASVLGIYADSYVMLGAILVMILLKSANKLGSTNAVYSGMLAGLVIFLTCLFKEDGIVFFAILGLITLILRSRVQTLFLAGVCISGAILFSGYGLFLWKHSGDFFLRLTQIRSGQQLETFLPGKCHSIISGGELVARLTYGPWVEMIRQGYFPVLISFLVLISARVFRLQNPPGRLDKIIFLVSLFSFMYFPVNLTQYQPVCSDMRHYLFLLPFGTVIMAEWINAAIGDRKRQMIIFSVCALCFFGAALTTPNKWKWMTFGELTLLAMLIRLTSYRYRNVFSGLFFAAMAFVGLERLFFLKSDWYYDLERVFSKHGREFTYLADQDNFMQWRLFSGFSDSSVLNLETIEFPARDPFAPVYKTFRPGWLVLNRLYTPRSNRFLQQIDSLAHAGVITGRSVQGEIRSYRVDQLPALEKLLGLMREEKP